MDIDILVNSCARPDILEVSLNTFKDKVKTRHNLRFVLLEDFIEDNNRRTLGRKWIEQNSNLFDIIVYADKRLGPGRFFAPVVKLCTTDVFFHLEDDNKFITDVYIDPVIDIMNKDNSIVEIILNRHNKPKYKHKITIDNISMYKLPIFSVATGIFNTKLVKKMIDKIGWNNVLHEVGVMTPIANKLKYKRFVLNSIQHYIHIGAIKGYRKGRWKNI